MSEAKKISTFGTFGGVFAPCVLTILGVIMFLRFGQVVGESGLYHALAIIAAAKLITVLTTSSKRTGNSGALLVKFEPPKTREDEDEFFAWTQKLEKLVPDIIYVHSARDVSLRA